MEKKTIDKVKVIKGLEICAERFCGEDCPYYRRSPTIGGICTTALLKDALALLREQQKLIDKITQRRANNGAFD